MGIWVVFTSGSQEWCCYKHSRTGFRVDMCFHFSWGDTGKCKLPTYVSKQLLCLYSHQEWRREGSSFSESSSTLAIIWILKNYCQSHTSVCVKWHPPVALICVSQMSAAPSLSPRVLAATCVSSREGRHPRALRVFSGLLVFSALSCGSSLSALHSSLLSETQTL